MMPNRSNLQKKEIVVNALDMNCVGCSPGLWTHPDDRTLDYHKLSYWVELAKTLEKGLFDSLFIADILGIYDVHGGSAASAIHHGLQVPVNDPLMLVSAMAAVTKNLCFGVTGTLTYEPPFSFARRLSTLDHLTDGRFAWNIVTGYLNSAAPAFGTKSQLRHDERYALAEEYMQVMYQLWEGSWEADAVKRDRQLGQFADPTKVHRISHHGKYFDVEGYHLCEPSPQRTPVLFQAGASNAGQDFAVKHAECIFISGHSKSRVKSLVESLRSRAAAIGRDPTELIIVTSLVAIPGTTTKAAQERVQDYRNHVDPERTLTLFGGHVGVDFSKYDLDEPLKYLETDGIQTFFEAFTKADPTRTWTLRELAPLLALGGQAPVLVGTGDEVADAMIDWVQETGVDGFNLKYSVSPHDFESFANLVVPALQERGVYKTSYREGTFREKLYHRNSALLPQNHPAASYRHRA